jgi:hypothetical protein
MSGSVIGVDNEGEESIALATVSPPVTTRPVHELSDAEDVGQVIPG